MQYKELTINRSNNFNFLRLFAALLVIYSHSFPLSGSNSLETFNLLTGSFTFGKLGVAIFFVISGYLITISWNRESNLIIFTWKRLLRIYPGLITSVLFSTFVVGSIATSLTFSDYISTISYLQIVKGTILMYQPFLPGVFTDNLYANAVNGSLWTLCWEARMYMLTAVFGLTGMFTNRWKIVIITFLVVIYNHVNFSLPLIRFFVGEYVVTYYLIGTLFAIYNIIYNKKILLILFLIWIMSFKTILLSISSIIFIPYLTLYLSLKTKFVFKKIMEYGDFSYGLYIYAFPIQQYIVHLFQNEISPMKLFFISFPATFILAYISWNIIEKKALMYKNSCIFERMHKQNT